MAVNSNVNPNYPAPGVDQDSRGFRDNFATIKQEIENLQSKTIQLVGPLSSAPTQIGSGNGTIAISTTANVANLQAAGSNLSVQYNLAGVLSGSTIFYTNNNVGINTNTPQVALDVVGNVNVSSSHGSTRIQIGSNLRIRSNQFEANITVGNIRAITMLSQNQWVGINGVPTDRLTVDGNIKLSNSIVSTGVLFSDGTFLPTTKLQSATLAMTGNLVAGSHRNRLVFLSGAGNLNINNITFSAGNSCIIRNTTGSNIRIVQAGFTNASVGLASFGFANIAAQGVATVIVGTTDNGFTTYCDVRGDLT